MKGTPCFSCQKDENEQVSPITMFICPQCQEDTEQKCRIMPPNESLLSGCGSVSLLLHLPERSFDLFSVSFLFPVVQFSTKPQSQVNKNVFTVEAACFLKSQESEFLSTFLRNFPQCIFLLGLKLIGCAETFPRGILFWAKMRLSSTDWTVHI